MQSPWKWKWVCITFCTNKANISIATLFQLRLFYTKWWVQCKVADSSWGEHSELHLFLKPSPVYLQPWPSSQNWLLFTHGLHLSILSSLIGNVLSHFLLIQSLLIHKAYFVCLEMLYFLLESALMSYNISKIFSILNRWKHIHYHM